MKYVSIILLFVLASCKTFFDYPAISGSSDPVEELSYMVSTDQKDRKKIKPHLIFGGNTKKAKLWNSRDSLRIVMTTKILDEYDSLGPEARMDAGLILFHRDPTQPEKDSLHLSKALELFQSLLNETDSTHILNGTYWSELTKKELD